MTRTPPSDDAGGHYVTSGFAVAGLGAFGLLSAFLLKSAGLEFGFIDLQAMGITCVLFLVVGLGMVLAGRKQNAE